MEENETVSSANNAPVHQHVPSQDVTSAAAANHRGEVDSSNSSGDAHQSLIPGRASIGGATPAPTIRHGNSLPSGFRDDNTPARPSGAPRNASSDTWQDVSQNTVDDPTLVPSQAREIAATFEKAREAKDGKQELANQNSLVPSHELEDWRQYYNAEWTPDRGSNMQAKERALHCRPALVETGISAGRSRVEYTSTSMLKWHMWHRDFFLTIVHQSFARLCLLIIVVHLASFFFFSAIWYPIWRFQEDCLDGISGYVQVYIFSMVTQQTIGYGNSSPNNCAYAGLVITVQSLFGLLLQAVSLGVLFARISHPEQRARSIFISEAAVISRRDGILKFMFRIADVKITQVSYATCRAYMYTWGTGRHTAEGEFIPVRSEELELQNIDGLLLLPITIEHTIDERSPLCGHTFDTLKALNAEIVVTFEGSTEMGNPFMSRQSYLANEIRWGHQFSRCIHQPRGDETQYTVDIAKFHQVELQASMSQSDQSQMSMAVVSRSKRTVPYPILGENTLVLSESMCLTEDNGELCLMFRVGDTYPNQILDPIVRAYVYRWTDKPTPKQRDYTVEELNIGYDTGRDRLLLWLPVVVKHVISAESPLGNWKNMAGFLSDAHSCITVVVEGYMYSNSQNRMRMRIYNCFNDVRLHHRFAPMVVAPTLTRDRKPRVDWTCFHTTTLDDAAAAKQPFIGRLAPVNPAGRSAIRKLNSSANRTGDSEEISSDSGELPGQDDDEGDVATSPLRTPIFYEPSGEYGTSAMTYEGSNHSSMLPHLNPQSTFNRQEGQLLAQQRKDQDQFRESHTENPSDGMRRGHTEPPRRMESVRAKLPAAWRGTRRGSGDRAPPGAQSQRRISEEPSNIV